MTDIKYTVSIENETPGDGKRAELPATRVDDLVQLGMIRPCPGCSVPGYIVFHPTAPKHEAQVFNIARGRLL